MIETTTCSTPEETFGLGRDLAGQLRSHDVVLLHGDLGAGKTVLTKGVLSGLGFDPAEVTSPSFALVNLYPTKKFDVYHIDLWRVESGTDAAFEVGLDDITLGDNVVVIIEWAERLGDRKFDSRVIDVSIETEDDTREITINNLN
jgi:tRNA threonylcarbamoyladenosine biosynthesis protein TsaE